MSIDVKTAETIAQLARLDLTLGLSEGEAPAALSKITEEFSKIVGYMDILNELDTSGVEPLYSPMLNPEPPREDMPRSDSERSAKSETILELSPLVSHRFFIVPKVV
ncbi:MAG: Asp-tRNA(Asn)/Glu-tRNA(Gln) amidotransferase subunit GatC [Deltaproteobacteria bacterium]|jgi:aspartyl-tRNA(Asn)/glutamyl-tRNA(Gln) amidotransferase subunit C|nr:Asp-tRNA(Asn)/Glu-tRNA(Gln) amidotransferase subunit GatC [Deltaproteobacteria bacterium]